MKIDLYTKAVLSVIAICLVILTLGSVDALPSANASPMPQMSNVRTNADGSINVKITDISSGIYSTIPVEVKRVSGNIPVEVKRVDPTVNVEVKNRYVNIRNY